MHMADALISPAVGATMWAAAATVTAHCARRLRAGLDERAAPLMGVLGAFVFAAQMINFAIPGTGSSGHLGGGLLLAILLGPHAAFITVASILTVQALFFADGGLLALGCNLVNLGFIPCFLALPLYRIFSASPNNLKFQISNIKSDNSIPHSAFRIPHFSRPAVAIVLSAILALQLGALGVVLQTALSGRSELPLRTFALWMQPIHLAIGIVEGLVTAAVIAFVRQARPELLQISSAASPAPFPLRRVLAVFALSALLIAGVFSRYASSRPDGLEWSVARAAGTEELAAPAGPVHATAESLQSRAAIFPDYELKRAHSSLPSVPALPGLVGAGLTLGAVALCGLILRSKQQGDVK